MTEREVMEQAQEVAKARRRFFHADQRITREVSPGDTIPRHLFDDRVQSYTEYLNAADVLCDGIEAGICPEKAQAWTPGREFL